ncbi:MAG: calcium/sodium antiporter [Fibrobacter sp.]|nr:calcium/sodium antiporter [Fibrobacter sp.]
MDYLFLVIGLALLLLGAEFLVDSSVAIAKKAKISSFIIGLTIVGMGTSAPELFVSLSSSLTGHGDVAVGNIVGSNICNIFLILGVSAAITPFVIQKEIVKRDIPFGIFAAVLLFLLANDSLILGSAESGLSRIEGILLLILFVGYMAFTITKSLKNRGNQEEDEAESKLAGKPVPLLLLIAVASLAGLIGGGNLFLSSAENLARAWGVSEAVIAITVVALGTSLPELITSVVAALKNNSELALGNVIGSNVFNALLILGVASAAHPISIQGIRLEDYSVMIFAALCTLGAAFSFRKYFFTRGEGIFFLICYVGYTAYLVLR